MEDRTPMESTRIDVDIVEVSPRDGIQNEATLLSTEAKVELVERAVAAGITRVEAASFAHPGRVPQMADAEAVLHTLGQPEGVAYSALVLNEKGYDRALQSGVREINMVLTTTDTFAERNQGSTVDGLVEQWLRMAERAHADGIRPTVGVSLSFGCPYEGEVALERLLAVCERALDGRPAELGLADSIGCAVPTQVTERFGALAELVAARGDDVVLRGHFHNTRNTGLANAVAAVEAGVRRLDASIGGVGGCPFAPNATGNIPTEDLAWMLERMGYRTGVDVDALIETAEWLGAQLGHEVPGLLTRARPFPQVAMAAG